MPRYCTKCIARDPGNWERRRCPFTREPLCPKCSNAWRHRLRVAKRKEPRLAAIFRRVVHFILYTDPARWALPSRSNAHLRDAGVHTRADCLLCSRRITGVRRYGAFCGVCGKRYRRQREYLRAHDRVVATLVRERPWLDAFLSESARERIGCDRRRRAQDQCQARPPPRRPCPYRPQPRSPQPRSPPNAHLVATLSMDPHWWD